MASYCANLIGNWSSQMFIDTIVQKGRVAPILLRRPHQFKIDLDYVYNFKKLHIL